VRLDAAEGARGVGSSSSGLICEEDGFGVSIGSIAETLSAGAWKSSGGVKVEGTGSSLTVRGTSTVSVLGVISELDTTLSRLLARIISVLSFDPR